jgi:hypothetical protein
MNDAAGTRLVEKYVERMRLNEGMLYNPLFWYEMTPFQVTIPFNFLRASKNLPQKPHHSFEPMIWDDDIPRKLMSEDGYPLVFSMPKLIGDVGTVSPLTTC